MFHILSSPPEQLGGAEPVWPLVAERIDVVSLHSTYSVHEPQKHDGELQKASPQLG